MVSSPCAFCSAAQIALEPTELAEERARRIQEMYYWRLRVTEVEEVFKAIQAEAKNGPLMEWESWLDTFQATLSGTPRARITGREVGFRELMDHLKALRQMLKPNAEIPAAGLLGLPLEPERDARETERRSREAAESARVAARSSGGAKRPSRRGSITKSNNVRATKPTDCGQRPNRKLRLGESAG